MSKPRCLIYCRVSSDRQAADDKTSRAHQEERCRLACQARGYEVADVFHEVDKRWVFDRPELNRVRQAIKDGSADIVMAMVMDRFSGDQRHLYILMDEIERHGGRLEFADEEYDDTPTGRFLRAVRVFMAEVEIERLSGRVRAGMAGAAKEGRPLGRVPLGFRKEGRGKNRRLVPDEAAVPLVRRIFSDVAEGVPTRRLIQRLEAEEYATSLGGARWSSSGIIRIVRNPKYRGEHQGLLTKTERVKEAGKSRVVVKRRDESERGPIFPGPRLVSDDLWAKANARLDRNKAESPRRNKDPETHLLRSSYAKCGLCGWNLNAKPARNGRRRHYRCDNKLRNDCPGVTIGQELLDAEVWSRVKLITNSPGQALKKMLEQAGDGTLDARIVELEAAAAKLGKRLAGLSKGIAQAWAGDDQRLAADLEVERKPLLQTLADTDAELADLREQARRQAELADLPSRLEAMWREDAAQFGELSYNAKRNLLAQLGVRAEVFPALDGDPARDELGLSLKRVRITMKLAPEFLYGWSEEDGDWDFDADDPVGEALNLLDPPVTGKPATEPAKPVGQAGPQAASIVRRSHAPCCRRHPGRRCGRRGSRARRAASSRGRAGRAAGHRSARRRGSWACRERRATRRRPSGGRRSRSPACSARPAGEGRLRAWRTRERRHSGR